VIIEKGTVHPRVHDILLIYLNVVDLAKLPVSHTSNGRTINEFETLWKEAAKIIFKYYPDIYWRDRGKHQQRSSG
jgi:hypothetical protein